jgi:hypothetical protein
MPAGGVGIRGWLSAIWTKLNGTIGVTGTFWQATQPVSGTFFQTTQPVSLAAETTKIIGTVVTAPTSGITHKGRAMSFRIPGLAGTAGQKLFSLHNATGSAVRVDIEQIAVDAVTTAVIAVTVIPPVIRVYKVTVLPTGGTAVTKVSRDSALSASSGSVTILQGASADGTGTTLTATLPAGAVITQEFAPRLITAAGYEMFDRTIFLESSNVTLNALEGIVVMLDYTLATANPTTNSWLVGCEWNEHT